MSRHGQLNLDAALTIRQLVMYFGGDVTYKAIGQWIHHGLLTPLPKRDAKGRLLIRLGDAIAVEARTDLQARGRPRKSPCLLSTSDL